LLKKQNLNQFHLLHKYQLQRRLHQQLLYKLIRLSLTEHFQVCHRHLLQLRCNVNHLHHHRRLRAEKRERHHLHHLRLLNNQLKKFADNLAKQ
jgi:hypothetical protein